MSGRVDVAAVLRRHVQEALAARQVDAAEAALDRLRAEDPLSVATRCLTLEVTLARGRLDEAEALARQLVDLFPESARVHHMAGRAAYLGRRYPDAVARFAESERLHASPQSTRWRGRSLAQLGRLDEAEAVLVGLVGRLPEVRRDLAWVYERRGDRPRALREIEAYLARHPADETAAAQRRRLRATDLSTDQLLEEVRALDELGEPVPHELLPLALDALLRSGRGDDARAFVSARRPGRPPATLVAMAWVAYKLLAYDVAVDLFLDVLAERLSDTKLLVALEAAAVRSGRSADLELAYETHAPQAKRLYGRLKSLRGRAGPNEGPPQPRGGGSAPR
jgi:tetratricopeptide (TPR) repeat protein